MVVLFEFELDELLQCSLLFFIYLYIYIHISSFMKVNISIISIFIQFRVLLIQLQKLTKCKLIELTLIKFLIYCISQCIGIVTHTHKKKRSETTRQT